MLFISVGGEVIFFIKVSIEILYIFSERYDDDDFSIDRVVHAVIDINKILYFSWYKN